MTVKEARRPVLRPPERRGSYIDLAGVDHFFAQAYRDYDTRARRVAKLFNHLLTGAFSHKIVLEVRCKRCHQAPTTPSCTPHVSAPHSDVDRKEMELGTATLRRVDAVWLSKVIGGVGPETVEDLRLLQLYL